MDTNKDGVIQRDEFTAKFSIAMQKVQAITAKRAFEDNQETSLNEIKEYLEEENRNVRFG